VSALGVFNAAVQARIAAEARMNEASDDEYIAAYSAFVEAWDAEEAATDYLRTHGAELLAEVEGLRALADSWDSRHKYGGCCCDDKARECAEELRAALAPKAPA
jgi:hypothetical protein